MKYLITLLVLADASIALASDGLFTIPEGLLPKVIVWVVAIQAICFGIGKGLTEIAVLTDNTFDNKLAAGFSKVAFWLGSLIAKFGWDVPRQVVIDKAETLKAKGKADL